MNNILQLILIIGAIIFVGFIIAVTKKKKLSYRYSILWLAFSIAIAIIAIFPQIIISLSKLLHIETPVNALFLICIFVIIIICFFSTIGYSKNKEKITKLVQDNAILKKKLEDLETKIDKKS